jgi:stage V sporulation protein SpoVS
LTDELRRVIYVFPDDISGALKTALREQIQRKVASVLPWGLKSAAKAIAQAVVFEGILP